MIARWAIAPLHPLNRYAVTGGALRRVLVAKIALAIFLGPAGMGIVLAARGGLLFPVCRGLSLIHLFPLLPAHMCSGSQSKTACSQLTGIFGSD